MVPLYSIQAWLALTLRVEDFNVVLEFIRKAYECIVLLAFTQLLICRLGGLEVLAARLQEADCSHLPPMSWLLAKTSWAPPRRFVRRSLTCLIGYVPVAMLAAVAAMWSFYLGLGIFESVRGVLVALINVALLIAMYGLIVFAHANHEALKPLNPLGKLLSIKVLLWVTTWQQMIITGAEELGWFKQFAKDSESGWTAKEIAHGLMNSLLILEMFLLSLWHHWVYPPSEVDALRAGPAAEDPAIQNLHSSFVPSVESSTGSAGTPARERSCCRACRRFVSVFNFSDIPQFYWELIGLDASRTRGCRRFLMAELLFGTRAAWEKRAAERRSQADECDGPPVPVVVSMTPQSSMHSSSNQASNQAPSETERRQASREAPP
eukprot:TRINITY_DN16657_c0_g2_i1.p1 TRINITY_DN16657_c0_g2~~TRINITY_DN16657_c0_g2_i1.p1  ORF type:complete len:378 (-),score=65.84 TRINITY_DN16657_c0_g2_i1:137-1270(-)